LLVLVEFGLQDVGFTDQLRSYPAAKAEVPQLANVKHVFVKAAARANNRAETATSQRAGVSARCKVSVIHDARSAFCRAPDRSGSTSPYPVTAWTLLLTVPS
jgi:hypothetical protein